MASLQDIRRRIRSVKNTQQVTNAMKMISAVKLRKSQDRLLAMRPYANKLLQVVRSVVSHMRQIENAPLGPMTQAFLSPRPEKHIRVVLVASDKGLCGGFNAYLLKLASSFFHERQKEIVHLDVMGKRGVEWAHKQKIPIAGEYQFLALPAFAATAIKIASSAAQEYQDGKIDALYVIYNFFQSPVSQIPQIVKLFPMPIEEEEEEDLPVHTQVGHLLEPDPTTILESLLPCFVENALLRCFLESSASEHGARMSAMDKASSNAAEMIDNLTLYMNKVRQANITNQIIEIVSGANA